MPVTVMDANEYELETDINVVQTKIYLYIWGGQHTIHCTDNMLQNCVPKTYVIFLTSVTLIYSIKGMYIYYIQPVQ